MVRWLLPMAVLSAAVLAACSDSGKEEVRDDVAAIEAAINDADYDSLYDDFSAASCRERFLRDVFVASFERDPFQLTDVTLLDQNIIIDGGTAYLILTATFSFADGRSETMTFQEKLAKEDGHWRDTDCFAGALGGPR